MVPLDPWYRFSFMATHWLAEFRQVVFREPESSKGARERSGAAAAAPASDDSGWRLTIRGLEPSEHQRIAPKPDSLGSRE